MPVHQDHLKAAVFNCMQDEEVVTMAKHGHPDAVEFLLSRYRPLVENKARAYFMVGADHDDVVQEGLIGLVKAIRDFRSDRLSKFRPFAELCVTRQIITAVKTATRQKHVPLNAYVSLNRNLGLEPTDASLIDLLPNSQVETPEDEVVVPGLPEGACEMFCNSLSDLEKHVLRFYIDGLSYREMSDRLQCHTKCIDNALQRIKRKVSLLSGN